MKNTGNMKISMQYKNLKNNIFEYVIIALIILITLYKLNLLGSGFLAFPDEFRYASSGSALKDFSELELKSGIRNIFSTEGRPGDALIKTIPNAIQFVSSKILCVDFYESKNSFPLFLFNFSIYACILLII